MRERINMAKVPTIIADRLLTFHPSPEASPGAFISSASGAAVGAGIENLGEGIGHLGRGLALLEQKRKDDADRIWATTNFNQFDRALNNFSKENHQSMSYDQDLLKFADNLRDDYAKKAPSAEAAQLFSNHATAQTNDRHRVAIFQAEKNRQVKFAADMDLAFGDAMSTYNSDAQEVSPEVAHQFFEQKRSQINELIDQTYGELSPNIAAALKENYNSQAVLGVARTDPDYARYILANSPEIDEQKRDVLTRHIEQIENEKNAFDVFQLQSMEKNVLAAAEKTGKPVNRSLITPNYVQGVLKNPDQTKAFILNFQEQADAIDQGNQIVHENEGKNPYAIQRNLETLRGSVDSAVKAKAFETSATALQSQMRLAKENTVGYINHYNPHSRAAWDMVKYSHDYQKPFFRKLAIETDLSFQGYAPVGTPKEELDYYMNNPTGSHHVMSKEAAEDFANRIKKGNPTEALAVLDEMEQFYGEYSWIARRDLMTLPAEHERIPGQLQWLFMHRNKTWLPNLLGSLKNTEAFKDLINDPHKRSEYEDALVGTHWPDFVKYYIGGDFQRVSEMAGYKQGLINYAYHIASSTGKTPAQAVQFAAQQLIDSDAIYINVYGQTLPVPRYRKDGTMRSDEDAQDLRRRAELMKSRLNPQEVNTRDVYGNFLFPILGENWEGIPDDRFSKWQPLRNFITSQGFMMPEADGQSFTLYVPTGDGQQIQLRDKENRPFRKYWDDLPEFTETYERVMPDVYPKFKRITVTSKIPVHKEYDMRDNWPTGWNKKVGVDRSIILEKPEPPKEKPIENFELSPGLLMPKK